MSRVNPQEKLMKKEVQLGEGEELKGEGYMAIYHDIEEINYGPRVGMPAKWRVFLCIRHKLLRDGLCEKHIGTAFVMEKTELTKAQIKTAIKALQADGLIISTQNIQKFPNGKLVYGENSYSLNPVTFGKLYNWYKNNPTIRVYSGGKARSYSAKGPVSDVEPGGVSDVEPGGVSDVEPGNGLKLATLLAKMACNNPSSNNPINNPSSENLNSLNRKNKKTEAQCKNPDEERERQFRKAREAGIL